MRPLHRLAIDFETFYGKDTTLSKLSYSEYVPRAEPYLLTGTFDGEPVFELAGLTAIERGLSQFNWDEIELVAHNALFDAAVLLHWFNHKAARYSCTLSAARYLHPHARHDLESLRKAHVPHLPGKDGGALVNAKDKTWDQLTPDERARLLNYAKNDTAICAALYDVFYDRLPQQEKNLIDHNVKLWLTPTLRFDRTSAAQQLDDDAATFQKTLDSMDLTAETLRSPTRFAAYLDALGYIPPTKWSAKQRKEIPAFAASDLEFKAFQENNPELTPLLEAKLQATSNLQRTRTQRLLHITEITDGLLPIGYTYYGAATGRYSGTNKVNLQNLPRDGTLRKCILAPDEDHVILTADLAQIEARILAWFAGQDDLLAIFKNKGDPYLELAKKIFGDPNLTKKNNPDKRQAGKIATLGLGYSMSAQKFQIFAALQGQKFDAAFSQSVVDTYRATYPRIRRCWNILQTHIDCLRPHSKSRYDGCQMPKEVRTPFGTATTTPENLVSGFCMRSGAIDLPSGRSLFYESVRQADGEWIYANNKKLYGGKLTENIIQALARDVMCEALLKIHPCYPIVMHTHDELVTVVHKNEIDTASEFIRSTMIEPPSWAPSLPLDVDIGTGYRYGDAK